MAASDNRHVISVSDANALAKAAADRMLARTAANRGRVAICLTGGSSPRQLYQLFATEAYRSRIPPTDIANPQEAARRYENELQSFYGADRLDATRPLFDVVLMGVGPDGHTASLFPNYPALEETDRWVVGVPEAHVEPFVPRVTLTLPALGSCREMLFEVSGSDKRAILTRVLDREDLPANRAHSTGETIWLVDRAALPENFRGQ